MVRSPTGLHVIRLDAASSGLGPSFVLALLHWVLDTPCLCGPEDKSKGDSLSVPVGAGPLHPTTWHHEPLKGLCAGTVGQKSLLLHSDHTDSNQVHTHFSTGSRFLGHASKSIRQGILERTTGGRSLSTSQTLPLSCSRQSRPRTDKARVGTVKRNE